MKKILALVLALCMVFALAACGGSSAPAAEEPAADAPAADAPAADAPAAEAPADMMVAMITDYGDITDQSFNQTTYEACKAWSESNGVDFKYYKPTSDSDADRIASIELAIDDGYNVIVMPGYAFANAVKETADIYSDVTFIALDVGAGDLGEDYVVPANLYCATYQEELCGYMAGYAAVKLGYTKIGFCGGMAVPAVIRYGYGFVQGADAAAAETGASGVELKYAYANQFYGDADITAKMDTWYGADIEIVKVIGVDTDQAALIDGQYGEGMTVTSAMKGLAATVNTMLSSVQAGSFEGGKIDTLGLVSATPAENYVQLGTTQFADGAFTEADYEALVAGMFDGSITVSNNTEAEPEVTAITVDYQGNIK